MQQFRDALNECELKEIHLQNRKFTWSNERRDPTLMKLDRVFCNADWDCTFTSHVLHNLSTSLSDHAPLLLSNQSGPRQPRTFSFKIFWTILPGFKEVVTRVWTTTSNHHEPFHILYNKLLVTAQNLRGWSNRIILDAKMKLHMALEVILRLDVAQENRSLSPAELNLRAKLKNGFSAWRSLRGQEVGKPRVSPILSWETPTLNIFTEENARRRKNHIQRL